MTFFEELGDFLNKKRDGGADIEEVISALETWKMTLEEELEMQSDEGAF